MNNPIGIVGGTALARLAGLQVAGARRTATSYGLPSGPMVHGKLADRKVCFVMRHGPDHGLAPHRINYRANIHALTDAGCQRVIAVNAVGGISAGMDAGRIVVPDQIIDYTWGREHTIYDDHENGRLDHIDFEQPYTRPIREILIESAHQCGLTPAVTAVHGVTQGPRLETAAEIDRLAHDGCDIVGMTGMPEAAIAREAGLEYACCAVVVNRAAGRGDGAPIHDEIRETLRQGMADIERLLEAALPRL